MQIPFAEIRSWMFDDALPFWGEHGVDHQYGGFLEELDLDGRPTDCSFKRVRAMCRQVYVFSHAALLGWTPGGGLSEFAYDYLVKTSWLGPAKGWAKKLSRRGEVIDDTPDLYDLAFCMFAMSWRHRWAKDADSLARLHQTLDFIQTKMRDHDGAGFWHALPPGLPRVQNPHMHLLEASLAAFEATEDERFLDQAREVVGLFKTYFFDGRTLGEFFTRDWQRAPGEPGRVTEPGHQFEWAWILAQYQKLTGEDMTREAEALVRFGEAFGVDAVGATRNQVRDDGMILDGGSRTWPNTERLKGQLALFELTGADNRKEIAETSRLLLDRYLAVTPRGSWIDAFDAEGRPIAKAAPTSTLYHVFLAFAEVLRLEPEFSR